MPVPFRLPKFYPILDTSSLSQRDCAVIPAAEGLLDAGVRILQYRHKEEWTQTQFDEAGQIAHLCEKAGVLFVLNDRADYARLLRVALHIGQNDLPPVAARMIVSDEVMGFSTHSRLQLTRASEEPVEYLSLGPIFETNSKVHADPVVGLDRLRELRPLTPKPLVAVGGITFENALEVLAAGADSVAVISGLLPDKSDRKNLRRRAEEWLQWLA
jgi:thiamine-phosphate pyrophosphorylase